MDEHIEAIRAAVAEGANAEQKAHGAQACRAILAALGAEPGKPITLAGAPAPHPLARLDPGQALDLLIARLSAMLPADDKGKDSPALRATASPTAERGLRLAFVNPPPRPRPRRPIPRRKP